MTRDIVVRAEHVTKEFILQENETALSKIAGWAKRSDMPRIIRALDDVSFELRRGEVLGVIGKNGSGKSTLLRVLAGVYPPDKGQIEVRGKLVPLINVSVGLQPKLTMRDNIELAGSLFGLSREGISQKFDSIVDFSELRDFLDVRCVKFSSGMLARLSFSVAIHLEPEILFLDEVLSTGDAAFQEKSRERMEELIASDTTVIMVSHSGDVLKRLCDRVIWLEEGRVQILGEAEDVVDQYVRQLQWYVRQRKVVEFALFKQECRRVTRKAVQNVLQRKAAMPHLAKAR